MAEPSPVRGSHLAALAGALLVGVAWTWCASWLVVELQAVTVSHRAGGGFVGAIIRLVAGLVADHVPEGRVLVGRGGPPGGLWSALWAAFTLGGGQPGAICLPWGSWCVLPNPTALLATKLSAFGLGWVIVMRLAKHSTHARRLAWPARIIWGFLVCAVAAGAAGTALVAVNASRALWIGILELDKLDESGASLQWLPVSLGTMGLLSILGGGLLLFGIGVKTMRGVLFRIMNESPRTNEILDVPATEGLNRPNGDGVSMARKRTVRALWNVVACSVGVVALLGAPLWLAWIGLYLPGQLHWLLYR